MKIIVNRITRGGRLVLFLVALAVLTGCQSGPTEVQNSQSVEAPSKTTEQAEVAATPAKPPLARPGVVIADTWTDGEWPLTIDGGLLTCAQVGLASNRLQAVFITDHDGGMWPLNGPARTRHRTFGARPAIEPIWRVDKKLMEAVPDSEATIRVDLGPLVRRGLALCN